MSDCIDTVSFALTHPSLALPVGVETPRQEAALDGLLTRVEHYCSVDVDALPSALSGDEQKSLDIKLAAEFVADMTESLLCLSVSLAQAAASEVRESRTAERLFRIGSRSFALSQDQRKLCWLAALRWAARRSVFILDERDPTFEGANRWTLYIRAALHDLLRSRLTQVFKLETLQLTASMITAFGEEWITAPVNRALRSLRSRASR
jgi:hypothetical protein